MIPLLLVVAGVGALGCGWLFFRALGPGARVGRILAATPVVDVRRARDLAERGPRRYIGVSGRIDSDEEFEDEHQRPLVYRRSRLETRAGSAWTVVEDVREIAAFELSEGLDRIAVDGEALDDGLVVVTREATGTAAEVPDRVPAGTPPDAGVRFRVEQLSSVDHGLALGVPHLDPVRGPLLGPGLGRPLILTNLERSEALRLLAGGRRGMARGASALLAVGAALLVTGLALGVLDALR